MIALKNVTKSYGGSKVLNGASLEVKPKECVYVVGAAASGKTTLFKMLVQADLPTSGSVEIDGVNMKSIPSSVLQLFRRRVGMIFQEPVLLEHATVWENVSIALELTGAPSSVIQRSVNDLLKRLKLDDHKDELPQSLSLSQRSLVGIARALVTAPMVIIADEPFAHLDDDEAETVTSLLEAMHKKGTSIIMFGKDARKAQDLSARVVSLEGGATSESVSHSRSDAKKADAHKLLEQVDKQAHDSMPDDEPPTKKEDDGKGKKIRITSIGSGLS